MKQVLTSFMFAALVSASLAAASTDVPPIGFDPTTPEMQAYLHATYASGLPSDLKQQLDTFFADPALRALLGAEQGMTFDTKYWNDKKPGYLPEYEKRADETPEQWQVRLATIDAKDRALVDLWRNKKGCMRKLLQKVVKHYKGFKLVSLQPSHIEICCRAGLVDYTLFIRCHKWYHNRFQLTSKLFYYDQWHKQGMSERFPVDMPPVWAYQHAYPNGQVVIDDTTCAIVVADSATACTSKKNIQALQKAIELDPSLQEVLNRFIDELGVWSANWVAPQINSSRFTLRYEQLPWTGGARRENVFHRVPDEIVSNAAVGRKELANLLNKKFGLSKGGIAGVSITTISIIAGALCGGYWWLRTKHSDTNGGGGKEEG